MTSPNTHGTSICIIQPLLKLSNFLAIIPPFNLVKFSKKKRCSKTYKVYTAFVLVIYLSLYGLSVYGRQMVVFSMLAIPIQIVDHVAYATLTLTNTLTSVQSVFFNYEEFRSFFEKTLKVECDVKMRMLSRRSFLKLFVPYVLAVLFLMLVDGFIWMHSLGWVNFRCYILRDIQYVHFCIINFLMFTLARVIEKRFSALNTLLSIVVYSLQNPGFKKEYGFAALIDADSKDFQYQDLKNIGKCYVLLCEMVDTFNKVFGSIIVSVALCTIAILLNNAILAINYSIMSGNDMGGTGFGMNLLILCLMWTFMSMVQIIMLAYACDGVAREAKRTPEICYSLLNDIPTIPKTDKDKILKEELLLIAQQATCRSPCISAAGFFVVNNSILGFILASVTSYIIVTIQFVGQN